MMSNEERAAEVVFAGLVFFEVFLPDGELRPEPGTEVFVDELAVGLGGALNGASVARALGCEQAPMERCGRATGRRGSGGGGRSIWVAETATGWIVRRRSRSER
jgi:hypothetical protein